MEKIVPTDMISRVQEELMRLDHDTIEVDGVHLRPSQCYHLGTSPAHVLFNTNCPDKLKEQVQAILTKYTSENETGS